MSLRVFSTNLVDNSFYWGSEHKRTLSYAETLSVTVRRAVVELKRVLDKVGILVEASSLDWGSAQEFAGIQQSLRNLCMERSEIVLSNNLLYLAKDLLYDPSFASLGEELLRLMEQVGLSGAKQATHLLAVFHGEAGSIAEYATQTLCRLSRAESYGAMAVALAGASFVGKALRLATSAYLQGGRTVSLVGSLAVRGVSGTAAVLGEAVAFPFTHNMGMALMGQQMSFANYGNDTLRGLKIMTTLNMVGLLSRNVHRAVHGVRDLSQRATRARTWMPYTKVLLHGGGELAALTGLSYAEQHGDPLYHLFESGGLMLNLRGARALGNSTFPMLAQAYRQLDLQTYLTLRNTSFHRQPPIQGTVGRLKLLLSQGNSMALASNIPASSQMGKRLGHGLFDGVLKNEDIRISLPTHTYQTGRLRNSGSPFEGPRLEEITRETAVRYYQGEAVRDFFPNFEPQVRRDFIEEVTTLLGKDGKRVAHRMDFAWVLSQMFPKAPVKDLMEKVDVSDQFSVLDGMIKNLQREGMGEESSFWIKEMGAAKSRGALNYRQLITFAEQYLNNCDLACIEYKADLIKKSEKCFSRVLFLPTLEPITRKDYVRRISDPWFAGVAPIALYEGVADGRFRSPKENARHDAGHAKRLYKGIEDLSRADQVTLLRARLAFRQYVQGDESKDPDLAEFMWFDTTRELPADEPLIVESVDKLEAYQMALGHLSDYSTQWNDGFFTPGRIKENPYVEHFRQVRGYQPHWTIGYQFFQFETLSRSLLMEHNPGEALGPERGPHQITNEEMLEAVTVVSKHLQPAVNEIKARHV